MEIYLIRHTAVCNANNLCYGQSEIDLRDDFMPAFEDIKKKIPADCQFISSPSERCIRLGYFLANDEEVITDDRLLEMNFGSWELQQWDNIDKESLEKWMNDYVNETVPDGESFVMLKNRIQEFWNELTSKSSACRVVITHAGVIRAILSLVLDIPLNKAFQLDVKYGGITLLSQKNGQQVVRYFNL